MRQEGPAAWKAAGGAPRLADLGIIDERAFASTLAKIVSGRRAREGYRLWEILSTETWLRAQ